MKITEIFRAKKVTIKGKATYNGNPNCQLKLERDLSTNDISLKLRNNATEVGHLFFPIGEIVSAFQDLGFDVTYTPKDPPEPDTKPKEQEANVTD